MSDAPLLPAAVRVPCSTSNLGAGFDCLGLAFAKYLTASYEPSAAPVGAGDLVHTAFTARLAQHGVTAAGGVIHVRSDIPIARGLGSSAAATVAGLMLADAALGVAIDRAALLRIATEREGHPDNAAPALLGGLVAVAREADGAPRAFPLPLSPDIAFVYAAPEVEVSTPHARAALPRDVPHPLAVRALGRMAALLRGLATAEAELLAIGLLDELHVPYRLPLIPRAAAAITAATAAGAWGATISGSGSGLIALCPHDRADDVLHVMEDALAHDGMLTVGFRAEPDRDGALVLPC